jgi:hypothetical protein
MTRRKFIQVLTKTGAAIVAGVLWIASAPRRFVRALPVKKYPGSLKPLGDVFKQSKWSG